MRCLGIPVDRRLRGLRQTPFKKGPDPILPSNHIRILSEFGRSLRSGEGSELLTAHELDFGLELARPECTGGLVIILYHPDPSQVYSQGYAAEETRCRTLFAIKDLISNAAGGMMDTNSITVLDSMPFITSDYDGSRLHVEAQRTFLRALEAKRPDVVLSCFRTESSFNFLKALQSQGIGVNNPPARMTFPGSSHEFLRISAFHPSYAVNRMAFDPCFRRLLMLEFHHAVELCWGTWEDKSWMAKLREQCAHSASRYRGPERIRVAKESNLVSAVADFLHLLEEVQYFWFEADTPIRGTGIMIRMGPKPVKSANCCRAVALTIQERPT